MKLNSTDVKLFMKLALELQWYAQQQGQILPRVKDFITYIDTSMREKVEVRDYLFDHLELIDSFVQVNPAELTSDELAIVKGWKNCVRGNFVIERSLKKYTVFIDSKERVYGVLGLQDEISDLVDKRSLPRNVNTVLLPFKGKIVYDGLLGFYNISFGSGIRAHLKEIYLIAKDNNDIIETLDPVALASAPAVSPSPKATQDWAPLLEDMARTAKKLRGGGGQPALYSPIFSLVRASIELAQVATEEQPNMDNLAKKGRRIDTLLDQIDRIIERS